MAEMAFGPSRYAGDLVDLIALVIVNSVTVHVPDLLGGGIPQPLHVKLADTGPYSEPFDNVLSLVEPAKVKASLYAMIRETGTWVQQVADRLGLDDVDQMPLAGVARAAAGRPNIQCSKTPMEINTPIMKCDTKSTVDGIRIMSRMIELSPADAPVVTCSLRWPCLLYTSDAADDC